mmetsp:Transcript_79879/g.171194  ORF Transcript_79879/g.171194 Transcript_79879/m.171194 type:complete len:334 (+) Transcript_79879:216-1217(+)
MTATETAPGRPCFASTLAVLLFATSKADDAVVGLWFLARWHCAHLRCELRKEEAFASKDAAQPYEQQLQIRDVAPYKAHEQHHGALHQKGLHDKEEQAVSVRRHILLPCRKAVGLGCGRLELALIEDHLELTRRLRLLRLFARRRSEGETNAEVRGVEDSVVTPEQGLPEDEGARQLLGEIERRKVRLAGRALAVVLATKRQRGAALNVEVQVGAEAGATLAAFCEGLHDSRGQRLWHPKARGASVDDATASAAASACIQSAVAHAHRHDLYLPEALFRLQHRSPVQWRSEAGRVVATESDFSTLGPKENAELRLQGLRVRRELPEEIEKLVD